MTALSSYVNRPRYQPPEEPEVPLNPLQQLAEQARREQEQLYHHRDQREQKETEPKEKITSRLSVLGDGTGSDWTDKDDGTSLASTATVATISRNDDAKIKQVFHLDTMRDASGIPNPLTHGEVVVKSDSQSEVEVQVDLQSRTRSSEEPDDFSLPSETVAQEDHIEDLLNQAVIDDALEQIQSLSRKRPKGLLLGKYFLIAIYATLNIISILVVVFDICKL